MPIISESTDLYYESGAEYVIVVDGGEVSIERLNEAGSWVEVAGSPVLDGEEKFVTTVSNGNYLRFIPNTNDVGVYFTKVKP